MDRVIAGRLLEINRRFYEEFGDAFAATRRRIQPGVRRVLDMIPADVPADWLDLGCGSGALGCVWAEQGRSGTYTGLDFSGPLLREARTVTAGLSGIDYVSGDLMDPSWDSAFPDGSFDGVMAFASLHHIPGRVNHERLFRQVHRLLKPKGRFILSVWQFQNSPKLMARVLPWDAAGLDEEDVEAGDTLLDWREPERQGIRYVHLFTLEELNGVAEHTGFRMEENFLSDGKEGNLAQYACFRRIEA